MKTIGAVRRHNLELLVKEFGTLEAVAEKGETTSVYLSQVRKQTVDAKTGRPREMGSQIARRLEKGAGKPGGWMDEDHSAAGNVIAVDRAGSVPVISWVQAGNWAQIVDNFQPGDADEWLPCPFKHGPKTYVLEVRGYSMHNPGGDLSFKDGDKIFVDPDREAMHRSLVIARLDDEAEATFKQLLLEGEQKLLQALNPQWPERIIKINGRASLCGVVIGKMESFV